MIRGIYGSALLALALSALPSTGMAQDDGELPATFTSDRPGFANTEAIAAVGRLTTEIGVGASFVDVPSVGTFPNLSLRAGLFNWLELRVRGPNGVGNFTNRGPTFGMADPNLGFKIGGRLVEGVAISSVWEVSVPIGTDGFGSPEVNWFADLNLAWNFWGPLTLTPNLVARILSEPDPTPMSTDTIRFFEGGGSLKLTWQIIDVLAIYVQSYLLASERSEVRVQVGGGLMWMVAPTVQLDASFDSRVTNEGDPPTAGIGTTILW